MGHTHFVIVLVKPTLDKHLGRSAYILVLQTGYTYWWVGIVHHLPRLVRELTAVLHLMMSVLELTSTCKKRRWGMVHIPVAKMISHITDMECRVPLSPTDEIVAKRIKQKTYDLNKDFWGYHYSILDLIEEDEDFDGEQTILDEHEEKKSNILDCLYVLLNPAKPTIGVFVDPCTTLVSRWQSSG